MMFSARHIRQEFSLKARDYDSHARMQHMVLQQAVGELRPHFRLGMTLLDAGCGTGYLAHLLRREERDFFLLGCDMALGMCQQAAQRREPVRYHVACADLQALPFADESVDLVLSSLTLQWVNQNACALGELHRIIRPGGRCLITTFGPMTLQELREAFGHADDKPHVSDFPPAEQLQEWALEAGFAIENAHSEFRCEYYASVGDLMRAIRAIGASNKMEARRKAMTGRNRFRKMEDYYRDHYETERGIPASWEVLFLMLHKKG